MKTGLVTSVTDELVAELEALARKATPGPWWIDSHGNNMVSESMDHQLVFTADDRMGKAERNKETGNLSHWPNDWDASYIATANPATILALLAERAELLRDAGRFRLFASTVVAEFSGAELSSAQHSLFDAMNACDEISNIGEVEAMFDAAMQSEAKP